MDLFYSFRRFARHFLKACLSVIAGERSLVADSAQFPLGSDREEVEDQAEISRDGDRALQYAAEQYNQDKVKALGHPATDDFPIPAWDASIKIFNNTLEQVVELYKVFQKARIDVVNYREELADDIIAKKDIYYAMVKHCYESEAWIRVYNGHIKSLNNFKVNRDKVAESPSKRKEFV